MNNWLDRVDVVLCRPEGALNVGACCRAMKSMGLHSLILVSPASFEDEEVYKMAVHARDVYDHARVVSSVPAALKGTILSAGITRRRGARRKYFSLLPETLAERVSQTVEGKVALVFGNERTGLSDEELNHCNLACHIPTSPEFPSLNLSHAVQILTSAFWRQCMQNKISAYRPISREELDRLVQVIYESLEAMNYFKTADRFHTDRYFRDILARAGLSIREARQMKKIFQKIQYLPRKEDEERNDV